MKQNTVSTASSPATRPTTLAPYRISGFSEPHRATSLVATPKSRLVSAGRTAHGHLRFLAQSATRPELFHDVLVSRDGLRVSCDCAACAFHPKADERGRLTVSRADVLAGKVSRCCWHLRYAARLAPLAAKGYALAKEARA